VEKQLKKDGERTSIFEQQVSLYGYGVLVNSVVLLLQGGTSVLSPKNTTVVSLTANATGTFLRSSSSVVGPSQPPSHVSPASMDGWNVYASLLVLLLTVLGLLTAGVVKHQSSIVKMFANNTALVMTVIFNSLIFHKRITLRFVLAIINLLIAVILYHVASGVKLVKLVDNNGSAASHHQQQQQTSSCATSPRGEGTNADAIGLEEINSLLHES
jgi:drug/metabolite transporter (DMT)-like permease